MVVGVAVLVLVAVLVVQAGVLRWSARAIAGEEIDWLLATGIVLVGGLATGLANCLFGQLGGPAGMVLVMIVDFVVYGAVIATFTKIEWFRAAMVGLVASIVSAVLFGAIGMGLLFALLVGGAGR